MSEEKFITENENEEKSENNKSFTRRKFLFGAGALATGMLASGIVGCSTNAATEAGDSASANTAKGELPSVPWTYKKFDVEAIRKRGYENYKKGGCMYAAGNALLSTLKETVGGPWNNLPEAMFMYGAAGAYGWGTLCGALNGALLILNLAAKEHGDLGNELLGWYTEFPFPSNKHEDYCHIKNQITTVANSPLCHVSVSTWANAADARINEDAKKERCAKLSGDTAARAAELLNAALEKKFVPAFKISNEYSHCMACHQSKDSLLDNEQGKQNCVYCHEDHTKKD